MKLIVDQMPKTPSECIFASYLGDGVHGCILAEKTRCQMEFNMECIKLRKENRTNG